MTSFHLPGEPAAWRQFHSLSRTDYQVVHDILISPAVTHWMEEVGETSWEDFQRWVTQVDKESYLFAALDHRQIVGFVYYYCKQEEQDKIARLLDKQVIKNPRNNAEYLEISFAKNESLSIKTGLMGSAVRQTCLYLRNLYHTKFHQPLHIIAYIDPENQAARRLIEHVGFEIIDYVEYTSQSSEKNLVYQLNWQTLDNIVDQKLTDFSRPSPADERRPVTALLAEFSRLQNEYQWQRALICYQGPYPIYGFISPHREPQNLWVMGGVHGEEPASGEAFFNQIDFLGQLGQTLPIVFLPLLNPLGRQINWRYENEPWDFTKGHSVTAADYLLVPKEELAPFDQPSLTAAATTQWVLAKNFSHPPLLTFDHHEDRVAEQYPDGDPRNISSCYVYMSGQGRSTQDIAKDIVEIFRQTGLPVANSGQTRFGEPIENGTIVNAADHSVDDLLGRSSYFEPETGEPTPKPAADALLVVETTIPFGSQIPLAKRTSAHEQVITRYQEFWNKVTQTHSW